MFAETDEKVVKANVCVNATLTPSYWGSPKLKTCRQGSHEALCEKQVQGRESVSYDGDSISSSRIDVESITTFFWFHQCAPRGTEPHVALPVQSIRLLYTSSMYLYWHDYSHGYNRHCIWREKGGVERGGFATTPGTVELDVRVLSVQLFANCNSVL